MQYFLWGPKFNVNVEIFNEQHKKLIAILNNLHSAMTDKSDRAALGRIILELIDYTKVHFSAEEEKMIEYEYPEYESHKKEHDAFVEKVRNFYNDFKAKKVTLSFEMAVFIKNWLMQHISNTDKKYGKFFNSKGIS